MVNGLLQFIWPLKVFDICYVHPEQFWITCDDVKYGIYVTCTVTWISCSRTHWTQVRWSSLKLSFSGFTSSLSFVPCCHGNVPSVKMNHLLEASMILSLHRLKAHQLFSSSKSATFPQHMNAALDSKQVTSISQSGGRVGLIATCSPLEGSIQRPAPQTRSLIFVSLNTQIVSINIFDQTICSFITAPRLLTVTCEVRDGSHDSALWGPHTGVLVNSGSWFICVGVGRCRAAVRG